MGIDFQSLASSLTQLLEHGNLIALGALFLIAAIVETGVPVPFVQDTVIVFIALEPTGHLLLYAPLVFAVLMAGRIFGGTVVYLIARVLGEKFTGWLDKRLPWMVTRIESLGDRLGRRSVFAVAIARLTPGLLTASSVAAGLFHIRWIYFCLGVMISSVIPDLVELGYGLAIRTGFKIAGKTPSPVVIIFAILFFSAISWLITFLVRRRHAHGTH